ncbi:MAG: ABC transporter ATP-binding protein [Candidatus Rokubacteria bacterium]|nr:ABC transporter ATP-binding protein [Candidatus Rokubacteria bacterium]
MSLLTVRSLAKEYRVRGAAFGRRTLHAVDGISLALGEGETLGLVGESGSGKSTLARCILQLERPTGGRVLFEGRELTTLDGRALRGVRRFLQMVFQDPAASLNPRLRAGYTVAEPLRLHRLRNGEAAVRARVEELFARVGLGPEHVGRYPHQLSGGQQQRIAIARALACEPRLVALDEPTSALDVSVQAALLALLRDLQARLGLAYLFISHDLAVVSAMADRVMVMYLGQVVEAGPTGELLARPRHPYTRALVSAVPRETPWAEPARLIVAGEPGSALARPAGCRFAPRCPWALARCQREPQPLHPVAPDHAAACWRAAAGELDPWPTPG